MLGISPSPFLKKEGGVLCFPRSPSSGGSQGLSAAGRACTSPARLGGAALSRLAGVLVQHRATPCHFRHAVLLCAGLESSAALPVHHWTSGHTGPTRVTEPRLLQGGPARAHRPPCTWPAPHPAVPEEGGGVTSPEGFTDLLGSTYGWALPVVWRALGAPPQGSPGCPPWGAALLSLSLARLRERGSRMAGQFPRTRRHLPGVGASSGSCGGRGQAQHRCLVVRV